MAYDIWCVMSYIDEGQCGFRKDKSCSDQGVHSANPRTVRDFFRMLRNLKITYTMYSAIKNFLSLCLTRKSFLPSGHGLGIISTRRVCMCFVIKVDKSNENYFLEWSFTSFMH